MFLKNIFGSCCQTRGRSEGNISFSGARNENGKSENMNSYSISTQSGNNGTNHEVVDSEHEITVSRSERVEKLVMSKKIENKDLSTIPMASSQRFKYGRSGSDMDNKSIVIDNPSFCEHKEFYREQRKETDILAKHIPKGSAEEPEKKKRHIKMWTEEEDELLKKYFDLLGNKWDDIASKIPGRNASQCSQRWRRRYKPEKVRKPWTKEEDQLLLSLLKKHGTNWHQIASQMKGNRTGKQVRERYINKLDPSIRKDDWKEEEDKLIYSYFMQFGPKWSEISKLFQGRPENMVKNRFYSHIKKKYGIKSAPRSLKSTKNSDTNSQLLKSENGFEQEFFEDEFDVDEDRSDNALESDDIDSDSESDDFSRRNQAITSGGSYSVPERGNKQKLTLELNSFPAIAELPGESSSVQATRSSIDNQSLTFFRSGMLGSSTTFKTEEGGVSLYPQEVKEKEMGNSGWNMDNSVDDAAKKFPSNIFAPEKIGLQQLLRHGTSLMSEEYNDFTPVPKVENNEEAQIKIEGNSELMLDDYLNIEGEKQKESTNAIENISGESNIQSSTSSSNARFNGIHSLKQLKTEMNPNLSQQEAEILKAELLRKLAEIDNYLQQKKEKDSENEILKK